MKHTPGTWCVSKLASPAYAPEFGIYAEGSQRDLARVMGENSAADAALIAAAPRLLAALKKLHEYCREVDAAYRNGLEGTDPLYLDVYNAIVEAQGD